MTYQVMLTKSSLIQFLQKNINMKSFTIKVINKEYLTNIYGVRSSKKINSLLEKDPEIKHFEYEVEDEYNDFQIICNLFNFQSIEITNNNMNSLKQFSEDLENECIITKINSFINSYELTND